MDRIIFLSHKKYEFHTHSKLSDGAANFRVTFCSAETAGEIVRLTQRRVTDSPSDVRWQRVISPEPVPIPANAMYILLN